MTFISTDIFYLEIWSVLKKINYAEEIKATSRIIMHSTFVDFRMRHNIGLLTRHGTKNLSHMHEIFFTLPHRSFSIVQLYLRKNCCLHLYKYASILEKNPREQLFSHRASFKRHLDDVKLESKNTFVGYIRSRRRFIRTYIIIYQIGAGVVIKREKRNRTRSGTERAS